MLHMDYKTIKKYWKVLEESGLVKYHGPAAEYGQSWDEAFMKRKKYTMGYYELSKERTQYRIIPRETVDKIISKYQVTELELKLYLFLANLQEKAISFGYSECPFTLKEARELMGYTKQNTTNKKLYLGILWLGKLNLIKYRVETKKNNNFNEQISYFVIEKVNYYTDGGEAGSLLEDKDGVIPQSIKDNLLNEAPIVNFE